MMIQGKSCTLTVAKDGEYYPLPYSEETVRQASEGYSRSGCIGIRNREKLVETGHSVSSGPRTTGDGYYESSIVAFEENLIEITE